MQLVKQHPWENDLGMGVDRLILIGNRYNYGTGFLDFLQVFLLVKQHPWENDLGMGVDRLILIGNRYNYGTGFFGFFLQVFLHLNGIHKSARYDKC